MLGTLGVAGVLGALLFVGGLVLLAVVNPLVAGGIAAVVVGLVLVLYGVASSLLGKLGMSMGDVV